jgi:hypothetical protein
MDPRRRDDVQVAHRSSMNEDVAGEERQTELLVTILPSMDGQVQWQKDFKSFAR